MPDPVTLVIPCFNEAERLHLDALVRLLDDADLRLLYVDDGSTDATPEVLARLCATSPERMSFFSQQNAGKAGAVRAGMRQAIERGARLVGYLDADLSTPPQEALGLVQEARKPTYDVVLGSRVALLGRHIERSPVRHYLGRVFATFASLALRLPVYDTQCGAKVFRVTRSLEHALATPFRSRWAFDVELLGRLLSGDATMAPVPVARFVEVPLQEWRHQPGSKITPLQMVRAALELWFIARDLRARERQQKA